MTRKHKRARLLLESSDLRLYVFRGPRSHRLVRVTVFDGLFARNRESAWLREAARRRASASGRA